jgi:hypothetical protein
MLFVTVKSCQRASRRHPSNTTQRQALHCLACRHNLSFASSASSDRETLKLKRIRALMSIKGLRLQPSLTFQDSRHSESMFRKANGSSVRLRKDRSHLSRPTKKHYTHSRDHRHAPSEELASKRILSKKALK